MKKNDNGMQEVLNLLKARPKLIRSIVFHPERITRLLRSKEARRLIRGVAANQFLDYIRKPEDGYPIAFCGGGTQYLCAKGTKFAVCGGSTQPTKLVVGPPRQRKPNRG